MRRSICLPAIAASAAMAASALGLATAAPPVGSGSNPIRATTSTSKGFSPKGATVKAGTTVHFRNVDRARHSVIQDAVIGRPAFTSGRPSRKDFTIRAPSKPGTYSYICAVHGFMRGTLIVRG